MYIGSTYVSAAEVRKRWLKAEALDSESLTIDEVSEAQDIEERATKRREAKEGK